MLKIFEDLKLLFEIKLLIFIVRHSSKGLTEKFISDYADILEWDFVSECAPINSFSKEFIKSYETMWDWECIMERNDITEEFIVEYKSEIISNSKNIPLFKQYSYWTLKELIRESLIQGKYFKYSTTTELEKNYKYSKRLHSIMEELRYIDNIPVKLTSNL